MSFEIGLMSFVIKAIFLMSWRSMTPINGARVRYVRTKSGAVRVSLIKCEYGRNVARTRVGAADRRLATHIFAMLFKPKSKPYWLRAVQAL